MSQDDTEEKQERRDFLISYTGHDIAWAEWIGAQLEQAGYFTFLQAWDVRPGNNLLLSLDQALRSCTRCLLVLSNAYLQDGLTQAQWAAVFKQDPTNEHRTLLPVKVEDCRPTGFLATHNPIDLFGLEETEASERLLAFLAAEQLQPGQRLAQDHPRQVSYPGSPVTWNLPYRRNLHFTGQEEYLNALRQRLWENQRAAVNQTEAISGLGGIGKTQVAVEYAYRHRSDYTHIFWVRAATRETIMVSYREIAERLLLPEHQEQDQSRMLVAVIRWLQRHHRYLLILDNADAPDLLAEYLPSDPTGHLLITTRSAHLSVYDLGLDDPLTMATFTPDIGAQFLLRRASLLAAAQDDDWQQARQISLELGGLPLALDQAGAYITMKQIRLARYQELYEKYRLRLLKDRHNKLDHPEPVVTTWNISFQAVEEQDPAAAAFLRFCAFLAPDAIPEYILTEGLAPLGNAPDDVLSDALVPIATDELRLDEAICVLRSYSLIERDSANRTMTVHRLVQEVTRNALSANEQLKWKIRAIVAIVLAFPGPDSAQWSIQEQFLPHAMQCSIWSEIPEMENSITARLLHQIGYYLKDRGRYMEAEPLLKRALAIHEQELGANHPDTAANLSSLASLYKSQQRYGEAEPLYERALTIHEQGRGADHPDTAKSLNNLALLYENQGRYEEAELLYKRALAINERTQGADHLDTATCLNNLAQIYGHQGRFEEAKAFYERAWTIQRQKLGDSHPYTIRSLNNLARLYVSQGKPEEAELLYKQIMAIREREQGANHPDMATSLDSLAKLYLDQKRCEEAEHIYKQALAIWEGDLKASHPNMVTSLHSLAKLYLDQKRYEEAEPLLKRALAIHERELGPNHPDTATCLNNLAQIYGHQGRYEEAEALQKRALAISEREPGPNHPDTATSLNNLAELYKSQRRYEQAEPLLKRALAIFEQKLGMDHRDTVTPLNNLAELYREQGRYREAEPLSRRALAIREKELGSDHLDTAESLNNLAGLYLSQGRYGEAEPLFRQALAIYKSKVGGSHPHTARCLNNLAGYYLLQRRYREAEPLFKQALEIRERTLRANHPDTVRTLNNLAGLYLSQKKYREAEPLFKRALAIREKELGANHPDTAESLAGLAGWYLFQMRYREARPLLERAQAIYKVALEPKHPETLAVAQMLLMCSASLNVMEQDSKVAKPSQDSSRSSHQHEATRQKTRKNMAKKSRKDNRNR